MFVLEQETTVGTTGGSAIDDALSRGSSIAPSLLTPSPRNDSSRC